MTERNRPDKHPERHRFRRSESGNVFFTLFGAVAIVGVLGAGIMATMRGPLTTMVNVQKKATAEAQMGIAAKLAILEAASQANSGDCDADQFVEPIEYDTAIAGLGGGTLPAAVGSNRQDPWGSDYGYCAWDAGTVVSPDIGNCTNTLLAGNDTNDEDYPMIVIVSAGPDRTFQTTCDAYSGTGLTKGGDDIVMDYTYETASASVDGLWRIKSGEPDTAEIDKQLFVSGGARFTSAINLTAPSAQLQLGAASMLFPTQADLATCNAANDQLLRVNTATAPITLEICDNANGGWQSVSAGAGSIWQQGAGDDIYYNSGGTPQVGIGNTAPTEALDVTGNIQLSGNVAFSSAGSKVGWSSGADITESAGDLLIDANGGTGVEVTVGANSLDVAGDTVITGTTSGVTTIDALTVENVLGTDILNVQNNGNVGVGVSDPTERLDVSGSITATDHYKLDGTNVLTDNSATGTVLLGKSAGALTSGNYNTILGAGAAGTLSTGTGNIIVGSGATAPDVPAGATSNYLNIGDLIYGDIAGNRIGINQAAGVDVTTFDDTLEVNGTIDASGNINSDATVSGVNVTASTRVTTDELYVQDTDNFIPGSCGAGSFNRWDGNSWECEADTGGAGGGTQDLDSVLSQGSDANFQSAGNFSGIAVGSNTFSTGTATLEVDVTGDLGATQFCDDAGNNCFTAASITGGTGVGAPGNNREVIFNSNGVLGTDTNFVFTSAGYMGIGTAAPASPLDVVGNIYSSAWVSGGGVEIRNQGNAATPALNMIGNGAAGLFMPAADSLAVSTNGAERMRVDASGNVGIGTATPQAQLDIAGTGALITPRGDTSQRPGTAVNGMIRYNSQTGKFEGYQAGVWTDIITAAATGAVFEDESGTGAGPVRATSGTINYASADFVFGSPQLADDGDVTHNSRMFFDKSKGAFRAGAIAGGGWNDVNVGIWSTALGADSVASGQSAMALGWGATASGSGSAAMGRSTIASGIRSTALGSFVTAGNGTAASGFGDGSMALGLIDDAVTITTASQVRGIQSMGIFMGDQDGLVMTAANTMGLFGGRMVIDPNVPATQLAVSTGAQQLELDVTGDIGAVNYCDEAGNNCFTAAGVASNVPGSPDRGVQFNSGGAFTADSTFVYTSAGYLGLGTATPGYPLSVNGRIETKGGMLFNEGTSFDDNLIYVGSGTPGDVNASFGFFVGGVGSASNGDGPYFLARGNDFSNIGNQRGNMYFEAGNPAAPASSEGSLNFVTGAEQLRMRITKDGNIGMNDPTPDSGTGGQLLLDVEGPVGGTKYCDEAGNNCFTAASVASGAAPGNDREMIFNSGGVLGTDTNFVFTSAGRLGIGLSNPSEDLHLYNGNMRLDGGNIFFGGSFASIENYGTGAGANLKISGSGAADGYLSLRSTWAAGTTDSIRFEVGNNGATEAMRIISNGNVGIGTSTPAEKLVVKSANTNGKTITIENTGNTNASIEMGSAGAGDEGYMVFYDTNVEKIRFNANGSSFFNAGDVGIGTTSPQAQLDIAGTGAMITPRGDTSERPGTGVNGMIRYNSQTGKFEGYQAGAWQDILTSGGGTGAIDDLSDAFTDYVTNHNIIMGRPGAAALTAGAADNTFIGENAGATSANSTSATDSNVAVGTSALRQLTSGTLDTAVGAYALRNNTSGQFNTALGTYASYTNTVNGSNTAVGYMAMYANTAAGITAVGYSALTDNTTGNNNVAMGYSALATNKAGSGGTAIGYQAMRYANDTTTATTTYNTAVGAYALQGSATAANNTGTSNTAVGHSALSGNTAGADNAALGDRALQNSTTADGNTALGKSALNANDSANYNTGVGAYALYAANGAGANNTAIGYQAGNSITTGASNILIGYDIDTPTATTSNYLNIGGAFYGDMATGNMTLAGTAALTLPRGDTSQRPGTAVNGMIRYNSQTGKFEGYQAGVWTDIITAAATGAVFEDVSGTGAGPVRATSGTINYASADFVFGSPQLADTGNAAHDSRMFFDKSKSAFRAGSANSTQWDDGNVGTSSVAMGSNTRANGVNSFAVGMSTIASSTGSVAMGDQTTASGSGALAAGRYGVASGLEGIALGRDVIAGSGTAGDGAGDNSIALGLGDSSAGFPNFPKVTGDSSFGIFMGDQANVNVSASNLMALLGGRLVIDPDTTSAANTNVSTGAQQLELDVTGDIGAVNYCDEAGNNCFTAAGVASNVPGSPDRGVQFNSGGAFAADSNFVYTSTGLLGIGTGTPGLPLDIRSDVSGFSMYVEGVSLLHNDIRFDSITAPQIYNANGNGTGLIIAGSQGADSYLTLLSTKGVGTTDYINFAVGNNGATEAMRIVSSGNIGIGTASPQAQLDIAGTGALITPRGTTAERPGTGVNGMIRYNSQTGKFEGYQAGAWQDILTSGGGTGAIDDLSDAFTDYATEHNIIMGRTSAAALTAGAQYNTFVGEGAGATSANSTATTDENTAIGDHALAALTSGTYNTSVGSAALYSNTSGTSNNAFGVGALYANTTGGGNTALGDSALEQNVTKQESTAVGHWAMRYADSAAGGAITYNTAVGAYALQGSTTAANNTGTNNTAVGHSSLDATTSGEYNTAMGANSLGANTTGSYNVAIGPAALLNSVGGNRNTAVGEGALYTGVNNTDDNTAIGKSALELVDGSDFNVALGSRAGDSITTGASNIMIGYDANPPTATTSNYLNIGGAFYGDMATGNMTLAGTAALTLPRGDTSQRPGTAVNGMLRYNSQSGKFEGYQAGVWTDIITAGGSPASPDRGVQFNSGGAFAAESTFVYTSTGNLGIGTTSPGNKLHIVGSGSYETTLLTQNDAGSNLIVETAHNTSWEYPHLTGYRARGTIAAKTIVQDGIELLGIEAYGYDGSSYAQSSGIDFSVDGTPGASDMPGRIVFYTTPDGSSSPAERMRIDNAGKVGIGTTTPTNMLEVASSTNEDVLGLTVANDTSGMDPTINLMRSKGTLAAKTTVASGDNLGAIWAFGHDGTDMEAAAAIEFEVDGGVATAGDTTDMPGNIQFSTTPDGTDAPVERMRITNAGNVGIGTTAPSTKLHLRGDGEYGIQMTQAAASDAHNPYIWSYRSKGTVASPTAVDVDAILMEQIVSAHDGTGYISAGHTAFVVDGTPGTNDMPTRYEINVQADGAGSWMGDGASTPEFVIKNNGAVGIGMSSPASKFVVAPPSSEAIAGAAVITADACGTIKQITSVGNQTTNTTDTFTAPTASYAGCCMDVVNVDTADTITLDSNAKFLTGAGSDIALAPNKAVRVCSDGTNWYQAAAVSSVAAGGSSAIDDLTDAYTSYGAASNFIMGRTSAAALTAGAQYNTFVGEGAGATTANSTNATDNNTATGYQALLSLTAGADNTAFGQAALKNNTSASNNTAVGSWALNSVSTAGYNTAVGSGALTNNTAGENSALGTEALTANTTGFNNTAVGTRALFTNVAKQESTAIGYSAMYYADDTATGAVTYNTALGAYALRGSTTAANNTGTYNTAIGHSSLAANTSGVANTAVGVLALNANTTGENNTALGKFALKVATQSDNTAIGANALGSTTTGNDNTAVGSGTLDANTTGRRNTALGYTALQSNKANEQSTAVGYAAMLYANDTTTGVITYNTAIGYEALMGSATAANNTGTYNTAIGHSALRVAEDGGNNTALGFNALSATVDGWNNVAVGSTALEANTTGQNQVAVGHGALAVVTTGGTQNTALGYQAGNNITTGDLNIIIGHDVDAMSATGNSQLNIGDTIYGDLSTDNVRIGGSGVVGAGPFIANPPASEAIAGAAVITANACGTIKQITSTGNVTTNTTNTFTSSTASYAGCCMDVVNVDTADTITLDSNAKFLTGAGSDIALAPNKAVRVCSDGTNWYQAAAVSSVAAGGSSAIDDLTDAYTSYGAASNFIMGRTSAAALTAGAESNTFIGEGTGATSANSTGTTDKNTALGYLALTSLTDGWMNTAIGESALRATTTGYFNVGVGAGALFSNTTGNENVAIGTTSIDASAYAALEDNTTGSKNVAIGDSALAHNTTKQQSTAVGHMAMHYADSAAGGAVTGNTALGAYALRGSTTAANNTGTQNTAIGHSALRQNTSGSENTVVGAAAMDTNTTGQLNTVVGYNSMYFNDTGGQNTAIGHNTMVTNVAKSQSTAVGYEAMRYADSGAAATTYNTAVGFQALRGSTTAANNTGTANTAVGHSALSSITSGGSNTAVGTFALQNVASGITNTAIGYDSLKSTTGNSNTALGYQAGQAGTANTSGGFNTFIGYQAQANANNYTNSTALGSNAVITASNMMSFGDSNVTQHVFNGYGALTLPRGDTSQRPGTAVNGMLRYNSQSGKFEGYQAGVWTDIITAGGSPASPDRGVQFNSGSAFAAESTFTYTSTGQLGVGTAAPAAKLHTRTGGGTDATVLEGLRIENEDTNTAGTDGIGSALTFWNETETAGTFNEAARIAGVFEDAANGSRDGQIRFYLPGPNAASGAASGEKMRLTTWGPVLPSDMNILFNAYYDQTGLPTYLTTNDAFGISHGDAANTLEIWGAVSGTAGNNISSKVSALTIDTSGNVGIGASFGSWGYTPGALLHSRPATITDSSILEALRLDSADQGTAGVDGIGSAMTFYAETETADTYNEFARIAGVADDAANGSRDGSLRLYTVGPNASSGAAATERMRIDSSGNVGIGTTTLSHLLTLDGDTAARTIGMTRETTAATAGRDLTISAGGAVSGGTNLAGGNLVLSSGTSTGSSGSYISFLAPLTASGGGTTDRAPSEQMRLGSQGLMLASNANAGGAKGISFNALYSGASNLYWDTDSAFELYQDVTNDILIFNAAASGTAGNSITFNPAIKINTSGSVAVGSAQTTLAAKFVVAPPASAAVAGAATITADACGTIKQITSVGNVTTNTTNTFTAPTSSYAGCCMDIVNVDTADTITLDSNANFKTGVGTDIALAPNKSVRVCSDGTYWYQAAAVSSVAGGGTTTFVSLSDVPSSYTSQSKKYLRVNSGETAVEFTNEIIAESVSGLSLPTGMTLDNLSDVTASGAATSDGISYNGSGWVLNSASTGAFLLPSGTAAQRPTAANGMMRYKTDATIGFEVREAGAWVAMGAAASDIRLKTDLQKLDSKDVLARLDQVQGYSYRLKEDGEGVKRYGVIAQELENVFPELVNSSADPKEMKSVRYLEFTALLIEASKELKAENDNLKAEIGDIKTQLASVDDLRRDIDGLKAHTGYGIGKAQFGIGLLAGMAGGGFIFFLVGATLRKRKRNPAA